MKPLILLAAAAAFTTSAALADDDTRNLNPPQLQLVTAQPHPAKDLKVSIWADRDNLTYTLGDSVQLWVQTSANAYVRVIDVGPTGETTQLYPNAVQPDALVPGGKPFAIPDKNSPAPITVGAPVGRELIEVIASSVPFSIADQGELGGKGLFPSVVGGADTILRNLNRVTSGQQLAYAHKVLLTVEGRNLTAPSSTNASQADTASTAPSAPAVDVSATADASAVSSQEPASTDIPLAIKAPIFALDKPSYAIGDRIELTATARSDCYLFIVDVSAATGKATALFPNKITPDNHLKSGETVAIAEGSSKLKLMATGPAGKEAMYAFCGRTNTPPWQGGVDLSTMFPEVDKGLPKGVVAMEDNPPPPSADYAIASAFFTITDK